MFWLNLSILIQIINKICIFKKCTLRNFKLIICMEKRIGVSLSACQALAPHAGQMLLITLVVLAGPVWVSVMREAACNPELCMWLTPCLWWIRHCMWYKTMYLEAAPCVALPSLGGEGCPSLCGRGVPPHYHPPQPRASNPRRLTGGGKWIAVVTFLAVGVTSSRVTGWKTLSQTLLPPCPGQSVMVWAMGVLRQAFWQKSTNPKPVCGSAGGLCGIYWPSVMTPEPLSHVWSLPAC